MGRKKSSKFAMLSRTSLTTSTVSWNARTQHWHPHYHVLLDGWIEDPIPKALRSCNPTIAADRQASWLRLRWADALRTNGLPVPHYNWRWTVGDQAPGSLAKLLELIPWTVSPDSPQAGPLELCKYVTKPAALLRMGKDNLAELERAISGPNGSLREWQPARGWFRRVARKSELVWLGSLRRWLSLADSHRWPFETHLAAAIARDFSSYARSGKDPAERHRIC